jgi:uncharacterized membrane protein YdbT with pleckstrin-like domain
MSYVENNLMSGEEVLYSGELHWITYAGASLLALLGLISLIEGAGTLGLGIIVIGALAGLVNYLNNKNSEFVITNKRVIMKTGVVRRRSIEMLLTKVEGLRVGESLLGRVLNFGTIVVNGTGGSKEGFHKISQPLVFRKRLQEILDQKQ